ncbi:hypothetical protein D9M70_498780 [compost metagenome]
MPPLCQLAAKRPDIAGVRAHTEVEGESVTAYAAANACGPGDRFYQANRVQGGTTIRMVAAPKPAHLEVRMTNQMTTDFAQRSRKHTCDEIHI